jgi:AcrR family transcriptional regulator
LLRESEVHSRFHAKWNLRIGKRKEPTSMLTPRVSDVPSRIIQAATALFSRQGFHGTSTREIARLADVSEVTMFRYFEHKDEIFWSALHSCFGTIRTRLSALDKSSKDDDPEVMLPQIISILVDIATYSPEVLRLVAVALLELHGKAEELCRENLTPLFSIINNYLSKNMETGTVRNLNPAIATAALALTVMVQPELSRLIDGNHLSRLGSREAIDEYSAFWLHVLVPSQECR